MNEKQTVKCAFNITTKNVRTLHVDVHENIDRTKTRDCDKTMPRSAGWLSLIQIIFAFVNIYFSFCSRFIIFFYG